MGRRAVAAGVVWTSLVAAVAAVVLSAGPVAAADADEAKALYQKATGEFGIGKYDQAAAHYVAAFELRPEPALLYNAAQAYRLAGNKPRALELYRNYLRLYASTPQAAEARRHVAALSKAIADEGQAAPAPKPAPPPPASPPPAAAAPPPRAPEPLPPKLAAPAPEPAPAPAVAVVAAPAPAAPAPDSGGRSIFKSPWLWVGVGALLLGAAAVVVVARNPSYPDASLGTGKAN